MGLTMNLWREKITTEPGGVTVRCKVYVMSTETKASTGGPIETAIVTVTIPPSQYEKLPGNFNSFTWRGATFYRKGLVMPIVALGKVDHYEITATTEQQTE